MIGRARSGNRVHTGYDCILKDYRSKHSRDKLARRVDEIEMSNM
jgi:hypothetical protein